jgi:hypothetical protein
MQLSRVRRCTFGRFLLLLSNGKLSWKGQKVFLTGSLAGWEVGLQRTEKDQLEIWFGRLLLGYLDPQEISFLRSEVALASGTNSNHSWGLAAPPWRRVAATRDLPTIAFFRAGGAAAT